MRIFKTSPFGYEIDLDNADNYDYLPNNINELRDIMFKEIGYSYWYMNFNHTEAFEKKYNKQKENIKTLIQNYTDNWIEHRYDIFWYKEQIFIFQNEIENMC